MSANVSSGTHHLLYAIEAGLQGLGADQFVRQVALSSAVGIGISGDLPQSTLPSLLSNLASVLFLGLFMSIIPDEHDRAAVERHEHRGAMEKRTVLGDRGSVSAPLRRVPGFPEDAGGAGQQLHGDVESGGRRGVRRSVHVQVDDGADNNHFSTL
ncbi:uncharacterized protein LOC131023445 [Salvia miltiorrhiza]|uniref:uncharacterized protein LOC131023445 n=1 Tax=Salvia miltiorrhiza TaxID=226208 RepID=UPI0025AB8447|nr:uncharacterized protein LOC131023445 [Salvia miltiorrhiza]